MAEPQRPAVLVLDDGELDDVQKMLEDMKAAFGRVRGGAIAPDTPPPRKLLISTPRRIQAVRDYCEDVDGEQIPTRIVVVEGDSNTLRARLREIGFDYIVRRPVHPEALRLLLLRCLYTGAERRQDPRVSVGYEISFRSGLLQRKAMLADLSCGGCRLLTSYAINPRKRIKVHIPESLGNGQPLALSGRVLRRKFDKDQGEEGTYEAALVFEEVSDTQRRELEQIIEARGKGPATLGEVSPVRSDPRAEPRDSRLLEARRSDPRVEPEAPAQADVPCAEQSEPQAAGESQEELALYTPAGNRIAAAAAEIAAAGDELELDDAFECADGGALQQVDLEVEIRLEDESGAIDPDGETMPDLEVDSNFDSASEASELSLDSALDDSDPSGERRHSRRGAYERKVPAFGKRALRVLVGRDLSMQGMRVESFPGLELGDRLHVALYGDADEAEPILVWATVSRDDGSDGIALVFDEVPRAAARKLEALVCSLPSVESLHDDECGAMGTVVGEVLET